MISSGHLALDTESQLTGGCECCLGECVRGRVSDRNSRESVDLSTLAICWWLITAGLIAKDSNNHLTDNNQQSFNEILEKS